FGVYELFEDRNGTLWARAQTGLWRWRPGPPQRYPVPGDGPLGEDVDGALRGGMPTGIARLIGGIPQPPAVLSQAPPFNARRRLRDRDGGHWITTAGRGLIHEHGGRIDLFRESDGLSSDDAGHLL